MEYAFENLSPEKFQYFAQALLIREFPNIQCFPVAQPDGGRDAVQWDQEAGKDRFIVFQVKYVRSGESRDPDEWLKSIAEIEEPKISRLKPGIKSYYLITNCRGSAHPGTGKIDQVNSHLSQILGIPAFCWWRDDLNRRLDNAYDLKWVYPELLSGLDLLRNLVEARLSLDQDRLLSTIRTFLAQQFEDDRDIRFKQVDLQNNLLELFVDVPIKLLGFQDSLYSKENPFGVMANDQMSSKATLRHFFASRAAFEQLTPEQKTSFQIARRAHNQNLGRAAALLLNEDMAKLAPYVVLEGAPGQGKSTVVQYLCQLQRLKLLDMEVPKGTVPELISNHSAYLPIKVDLRDLASWLRREDPFSASRREVPKRQWHKSIDALLAALVREKAGGAEFSISDLHAITRLCPLLLVLDGLDEVADRADRQEVVDEILRGVTRLAANAESLRVIVTSRPAAFSNSPELPRDKFYYCALGDLEESQIAEYSSRWIKARRLKPKEGSEVSTILMAKIRQPHLRDLARNPMQLAILLRLIHTRGASLPDKRTALYDSYIDQFLNRESEKSDTVRDHRELILRIHQYLGWLLHAEAESGKANGSPGTISQTRLREVLKSYLERQEYDPQLVDELFTGIVERVLVLVSRVEGSFEFEVQPLREYFAARFLYETAPYSPPGSEKQGSKLDRFDALARNFYWLNVARFYVGCYSAGELPSLISGLQDLLQEEIISKTDHPRVLAAYFLADWVFSQSRRSLRQLIDLLLDGPGIKMIASGVRSQGASPMQLSIPVSCGHTEFIARSFSLAIEHRHSLGYLADLATVLNHGLDSSGHIEEWLKLRDAGFSIATWLAFGRMLGYLQQLNICQLEESLSDHELSLSDVQILLSAGRADFLQSRPGLFQIALDQILDGFRQIEYGQSVTFLEIMAFFIDPSCFSASSRELPLGIRKGYRLYLEHSDTNMLSSLSDRFPGCGQYLEVAKQIIDVSEVHWHTDLGVWDKVVEAGRKIFGDRDVFFLSAVAASGIRNSKETCVDAKDLLRDEISLCRRFRYARLRSGSKGWWRKIFERILERQRTGDSRCLLPFVVWASHSSFFEEIATFDRLISQMDDSQWRNFFRLVESALGFQARVSGGNSTESSLVTRMPVGISLRAYAVIGLRINTFSNLKHLWSHFKDYRGSDPCILKICRSSAYSILWRQADQSGLAEALAMISHCYQFGAFLQTYWRYDHRISMWPKSDAERVINESDCFPSDIVAAAGTFLRIEAGRESVPLATISTKNGWFSE